MKDVSETRGKIKANMPWFKCYPEDWLRKTRNLNLEQRAVYWDCLCLLYTTEAPIKQDDKWMSHYLHISPRLWRSVRDQLVGIGFLKETPAGLVDDRALEEIEKRAKQRRTNSENSANRERTKLENSKNCNEINETKERKQHHIENIDIEKIEEEKKERKEHCAVPPSRATARRNVSTDELDQQFEEFWKAFPSGRKKGKGKAKSLFRQIARGGHHTLRASAEDLIAAAKAYAATKPDPQYTPMPQTWLAGGRWEDDPADSRVISMASRSVAKIGSLHGASRW